MLPQQDAQENVSSGTLKGDYHENLNGALYPLSLLGTPIDMGQSWSGAMLICTESKFSYYFMWQLLFFLSQSLGIYGI